MFGVRKSSILMKKYVNGLSSSNMKWIEISHFKNPPGPNQSEKKNKEATGILIFTTNSKNNQSTEYQ